MPKTTTATTWNAESRAIRRLYRVVREVLTAHPTETSGEIAALVKDRLRRMHLSWTPRQLHDALSLIDRRPLARPPPTPPVNEARLQVDPPWGPYDRGSSQWTTGNPPSDRSKP